LQYFEGKLYGGVDYRGAPLEGSPPAVDVTLVAEITARLLELRDIDRRKPIELLLKLQRTYRISPFCLWITCEILASNTQGGKSLAQIANEINVSKQSVHQQQIRELELLADTYPDIAATIREILGRSRAKKA